MARLDRFVLAGVVGAVSLLPAAPSADGRRHAVRAGFPPSYSPPAWSPSGRRLAFVRYPLRRAVGVLLLQSRAGGDARRLFPRRGLAAIRSVPVSWSPDGRTIAFVEDLRLRVLEPSTERTRTLGRWPDWSARGQHVAYVATDTGEVRVIDLRTRRVTRVARGTSPAWSPDGRRLAFYRTTSRGAALEVRTLATRTTRTLAPFGVEISRPPAWSPDGRTLAFSRTNDVRIGSYVTTRISLFVIPAAETAREAPRRVATVGYTPAFAPDGRTLAFVAPKRGCGSLIFTVRLDGRALRPVSSCR